MTRHRWVGHSRFDDHLGGVAGIDDEDLAEDEPLAAHYRRQAESIRRHLQHPPTDPGLRAQLERDLAAWERAAAAATIDDHWSSGAGDRPMF